MKTPIERAADIVGSQVALSKELHVSKALVSLWVNGASRVAAQHCPLIERLTDGQVRCEELRPDIQWGLLRATDCPTQKAA